MDFFTFLIFAVICIFILYFIASKIYFYNKSEYLKSNIYQKSYLIKNTENKYEKVKMIDKLLESLNILLEDLKTNEELNIESDIDEIQERLKKSEVLENIIEEYQNSIKDEYVIQDDCGNKHHWKFQEILLNEISIKNSNGEYQKINMSSLQDNITLRCVYEDIIEYYWKYNGHEDTDRYYYVRDYYFINNIKGTKTIKSHEIPNSFYSYD